MASYTAGTLELSVLGISDGAVSSIEKTVKALNSLSTVLTKLNSIVINDDIPKFISKIADLSSVGVGTSSIDKTVKSVNSLYNAINKINDAPVLSATSTMSMFFTKMADATKSIDTTALDTLSSSAKSISSIAKLSKLEDLDYDKIATGFSNLATAITPFLDKVKSAEASLSSLYGILSKSSGKKIQNLLGGGDTGSKKSSGFGLLNIAKWTAVFYTARRLGNVLGEIAQSGADYTETLNLWETAMGNNLQMATEFVNKMNDAYGISEKTLMNAQAIFKNMLGSLGEISEATAYQLSEGITQMALDYASLYNVQFEDAFTKFQAALAGQVRPIRSVSGYDITENTLFQLYQSLGGTKTMRQLSRTEKQLLAIYAVFQQMDRSGALGDLDKTIESFANQSRVMAEAWSEVLTYSGILVTYLIQENGWLQQINGVLIFIGETLKSVVDYYGAIQSYGGDIFDSTTEGATDAADAIDEVSGKLLDFDKFRSLSSSQQGDVDLDQKLLDALTNYDTILGNAGMEARNLANQFMVASGLFDEKGVFQPERWEEIIDKVKELGEAIKNIAFIIVGYKLASRFSQIGSALLNIGKTFSFKSLGIGLLISGLVDLYITSEDFRESINSISETLSPMVKRLFELVEDILVEIVPLVSKFIEWADNLGILEPLLATLITMKVGSWISNIATGLKGLVTKYLPQIISFLTTLGTKLQSGFTSLLNWVKGLDYAKTATLGLQAGIALLIANITLLATGWSKMTDMEKVVGIFGAIGSAALIAAAAVAAFHGAWTMGTAAVAIVGGLAAIAGAFTSFKANMRDLEFFADGGLPDKGTMFIAGEQGAEIVYNNPDGQSGVANVQQIAQATYQGTMSALRDWWGGTGAKGDIPQLKEANATGMYQAVTGVAKSYGEKWNKY